MIEPRDHMPYEWNINKLVWFSGVLKCMARLVVRLKAIKY